MPADQTWPSGVFHAIWEERKFQDDKYGPITGKGGHSLAAWLIIVESELNEAKLAVAHGGHQSREGRDSVRSELVQIAAVAVAALEQHGVKELPYGPGKDPDAAYSEYAEKARAAGADPV